MKLRAAGLFAALLVVAGCTQAPAPDGPTAEVRGEPIANGPSAQVGLSNNPGLAAPAAAAAPPAALADSAVASGRRIASGSAATPWTAVGFDTLSGYDIEISDEILGPVTNDLERITAKTEALIPAKVKAYDNKHVAIKGFMLPLKVEKGLVTELLILKDQSMCCYGTPPKIHEWVSVKMADKGVKPLMDQPVTLFGTLHVGEMRENGFLVGIYRMEGERLGEPVGN